MHGSLHRPCPLCGDTELEALIHVDLPQPSNSPLPSGYRLVACNECDLVYADTPATQHDYDRYYRDLAKYAGPTGTSAGNDAADQQRLIALANRLERWLPCREARILDIGCGAGGLLKIPQDRGFPNAEGLDPDPIGVRSSIAQGLTITEGLISQAPSLLTGQQFDLIVLSHVAEHLRDLHWLDELIRLLTPDGHLYIEVPDPRGYHCGPRPPFYYFDSEHINHFGPRALTRLFARMGLTPHDIQDCPLSLTDGSLYPALAGVASRGTVIHLPPHQAINCIRSYLDESGVALASQCRITPPLNDKPILVWGAGSFAQRLLGAGAIPLWQVQAFLDGAPNKQGRSLAGKPVLSPTEGIAHHPNAEILVCIAVNPKQVEAELARISPGTSRTLHYMNEYQ